MNRILFILRARALGRVHCHHQNYHHHPSHITTTTTSTPVLPQHTYSRSHRPLHASPITLTPLPKPHQLPPRPKIREEDITETFLKGSGPGGQKINKTASAVQLTHTPTGIVLKSQATRSRTQNRKIARQLLATKIDNLTLGEGSRESIKAKLEAERKARGDKKKRRKYRALAEEWGREDVVEDGEEEDGEGEEGEAGISNDAVNEGKRAGGGEGEDAQMTSHGERNRHGQQKARERYEPEGSRADVVKKLFDEARERMGREGKG